MNKHKTKDYLGVVRHKETLKYHGAYYRFKPTPSGCDRWLLWQTTTEGYDDEATAALAIQSAYPEMKKIVL